MRFGRVPTCPGWNRLAIVATVTCPYPGGSAEAPKRMRRTSTTVGHFAPWLLVALVGLLVVLTLVPALFVSVPWQVPVLLMAVAIGLGSAVIAHNRHLCERCIAVLPLDAAATAARYGVRFRVAHLFERRVFALCYLCAIAGCAFLYSHPVGRYGFAVAQASLAYLLLVYVTHQRLQPWCPYCRNGGTELATPTSPEPVTSGL